MRAARQTGACCSLREARAVTVTLALIAKEPASGARQDAPRRDAWRRGTPSAWPRRCCSTRLQRSTAAAPPEPAPRPRPRSARRRAERSGRSASRRALPGAAGPTERSATVLDVSPEPRPDNGASACVIAATDSPFAIDARSSTASRGPARDRARPVRGRRLLGGGSVTARAHLRCHHEHRRCRRSHRCPSPIGGPSSAATPTQPRHRRRGRS